VCSLTPSNNEPIRRDSDTESRLVHVPDVLFDDPVFLNSSSELKIPFIDNLNVLLTLPVGFKLLLPLPYIPIALDKSYSPLPTYGRW
jgi:hypothetical protein